MKKLVFVTIVLIGVMSTQLIYADECGVASAKPDSQYRWSVECIGGQRFSCHKTSGNEGVGVGWTCECDTGNCKGEWNPDIKVAAKTSCCSSRIARNRFIAYNNGTVLDTRTNLMWAAEDNGSNINWADGKSYCENYRGGGYTDWRMPTTDELVGLYDKSIDAVSGCKVDCGGRVNLVTELIHLTCRDLWASETRVLGTEKKGLRANKFNFGYGGSLLEPQGASKNYRVLPVRSNK